MTHVAIVCDDASIQPLLPHILICRKTLLRPGMVDAIAEILPPNFKVLGAKSAWTNEAIMCYVVRLIAEALQPVLVSRQPILFMDTAASHLHESVIKKCYTLGVWLGFVLAGTTWAFQVLDTHCFGTFKQRLARRQSDMRSRLGGARLTIVQWVECFINAAKRTFQGKEWKKAFDDNGFSIWDLPLRGELMRELSWTTMPPIDRRQTDIEDFRVLWPLNKKHL